MQTFLPYGSFIKSARCLDNKRLGKQRVETLQILNALYKGAGWGNHPATKMWKDYRPSLVHYGLVICEVWRKERGFNDTCFGKIRAHMADFSVADIQTAEKPHWFGNPDFHRAHRSNLLRKDPEFYGPQFEPDLPNDLEYIWPA